MHRLRCRLAALALSLTMLTLAGCTSAPPDAQNTPSPVSVKTRPNIVFVLTDDLSSDLVPYLPNVQKLRQRGMRFTNYFVTNSLCCPSRASTLTGGYPHSTKVLTNGGADGGYSEFTYQQDDLKTFATSLQSAGYTTAMLGKYLNGYRLNPPAPQPQLAVPPGWDNWFVPGDHDGYSGFNYTLNENGTAVRYGNSPNDYLTDVLSRKAVDIVKQASARQQPFMIEVSTFAPHAPYTPAPRHAGLFPDLRYPRTAAFDQLGQNPPPWLSSRAPLKAANKTWIDRVFRMRVQSMQSVDDMVGSLTDTLREQGILDNTYFVFTSDNGLHMGEHRLNPGKMTAFDTDIRVPLIVAGPGIRAGSTNDAITANIDLCPTFEELGQGAITSLVDGRSLLPLFAGQTPSDWRRSVLVEQKYPGSATAAGPDAHTANEWPPTYQGVRTKDALYVSYADGSHSYYDLERDPHELNNVAGRLSSAQRDRLALGLNLMSRCSGTASCAEAEANSAAAMDAVRDTAVPAQPKPTTSSAATSASGTPTASKDADASRAGLAATGGDAVRLPDAQHLPEQDSTSRGGVRTSTPTTVSAPEPTGTPTTR